MKRVCLLMLFYVLTSISCVSCGGDLSDSSDSENTEIVGTKWIATNWDYSIGDDWVGLHEEYFQFFFISPTEGICYYGRKDDYSDMDTSVQRVASHFTYYLQGNEITLDYITDHILPNRPLVINGKTLTTGELILTKEQMSYADYEWINSVYGMTGDCLWYSDMCGTIWIIGEGAMANYTSYSTTPWSKNNRTPNKVVIEEGVTTIGSYAFANQSIADVETPDKTLTDVGDAAFKGASIESIWMSHATVTIGKEAFAGCTYLKSINIPENLVSVGEYAFYNCTALNEFQLEFGSNLRTIGTSAFEGGKASYLIFAEGVESISTGAFIGNYCSISKELELPNSLTAIGATVFEGPYKTIVLGTKVKEIGEKAFISGATSGKMYVNLSTPPVTGTNIIVDRNNWNSAESRWTLYVPKGCKSTYSSRSPWNKFKSIIEDSNLQAGDGDNSNNNGNDNSVDIPKQIVGSWTVFQDDPSWKTLLELKSDGTYVATDYYDIEDDKTFAEYTGRFTGTYKVTNESLSIQYTNIEKSSVVVGNYQFKKFTNSYFEAADSDGYTIYASK